MPAPVRALTAIEVDVVIPYDQGALVSRVHAEGEVLQTEHLPAGTRLVARVHPDLAAALPPAGY